MVAVGIEVDVGRDVSVGIAVDVAVGICVEVAVGRVTSVGKVGIIVTPGVGVRGGILGTQSRCPT
jgi:hypothetical protein